MARYYESEALIEFVKQNTPHINGETTMKCVEFAIKNAPTADVVPKSDAEKQKLEIWRLQGEVERLTVELETMRTAANSYKMHYENLAREIFEEIEKIITPAYLPIAYGKLSVDFAELKKKYTEGESNG